MNTIIMNFSHVYESQDFYKEGTADAVILDCSHISGTNCYCDEEAKGQLMELMRKFGPEGIHFLDSGNYHYVSRLWLEQIKEDFELVVFDHHTDMQLPAFGDILSCGGWIKAALDGCERLKRVWLIGPPALPEEESDERVYWFGEEKAEAFGAFGEVSSRREPLPVYISVDKDVFRLEDARTNWDQGTMELERVLSLIRDIAASRPVIGMDVCGENPEAMDGPEADEVLEINNRANWRLLEAVREIFR